MSAFLVSPECMHKVVTGMLASPYNTPSVVTDPDEATALGRKLFAMNERALRARYGGRATTAAEFGAMSDSYVFSYSGLPVGRPAIVKAMKSFLYQCTEGEVDEEHLYAEVKASIYDNMSVILDELAAYKAAAWG